MLGDVEGAWSTISFCSGVACPIWDLSSHCLLHFSHGLSLTDLLSSTQSPSSYEGQALDQPCAKRQNCRVSKQNQIDEMNLHESIQDQTMI